MRESMRSALILLLGLLATGPEVRAEYPLRVHPQNWRYFTDGSGKTIVFSGSHTWMRRVENKRWISDGWDIDKFNKYLDFHKYWNLNYTRVWMWEHKGDVDIWEKTADGKYDLSRLNQAYFDLMHSFAKAAEARGMYYSMMLFQGWSGTCDPSSPNWPHHPMNKDNNINGIDGNPNGIAYGNKVHSLENPEIVRFQEMYVRKMIDELNDCSNLVWEIANEPIAASLLWKAHMVRFIRECEKSKPTQHLILDGTGNGIGNESVWITNPDIFCPCAIKEWGTFDEPYIANPPVPDDSARKPSILDNDHIGNHFLRFTALDQRNWTWKAFTRGHHPVHMDCYDVFWDKSAATPDHPIPGVATNPHYDPQRKSMGDVLRYAEKIDIANMLPVDNSLISSTTFCLVNTGREYLAYQPEINGDITLNLPTGVYEIETFDTMDSSVNRFPFQWQGGYKTFPKPTHVSEDWVLLIKTGR